MQFIDEMFSSKAQRAEAHQLALSALILSGAQAEFALVADLELQVMPVSRRMLRLAIAEIRRG
jgi:hypothetical protein